MSKENKKPTNIVYVFADQWRASAFCYAGDLNVTTPNIDRLARQCLNFRNAVAVSPICTPYRASLMTGRFPTTTGMFMNDLYLPDHEHCIAEVLSDGGYDTAYIGKWHLDGHGREAYIPPERRQGWDYWKVGECEHNYMHSHYYDNDSPQKHYWPGYDAFAQTKDACNYLQSRKSMKKPFALFVSYGPPHNPHFLLPPEYLARCKPEAIRLPPNVPPELHELARKEASGYYQHCEALDRCVGEIVDALDKTGLTNNTILVFTSDHGEMMGSHGCNPFMKQVPWSESAHVPFLLRLPFHTGPGRSVETPVTTPDISATLLGLAGVAIPDSFEGRNLAELVKAGNEEDRAALYMLVSPFTLPERVSKEYRAIRTRQYTYVRSIAGPWLLYDDHDDPYQLRNLVDDPAHANLRKELDTRLHDKLRKINDPFKPRERYLQKWGYTVNQAGEIPYLPGAKVQMPAHPNRRR